MLLPVLAVISRGARVGGVAGALLIVVAVALAFVGSVPPMGTVGGWRVLIKEASSVDEHTLLKRWGLKSPIRQGVHAWVMRVLEPGLRRG
ncbi:hypothetical protein AB0J74_35410 [Asanoa sp. NPDC049573]|uniref:hypothetical protein n=1 Tax=Asanoa sp. NPDC049573 TaxID=3155396 RepID=UPI003414B1D5